MIAFGAMLILVVIAVVVVGWYLYATGAWVRNPVNHPPHYTEHPSGVERITIVEHIGFIWRADLKGDAIEDLRGGVDP